MFLFIYGDISLVYFDINTITTLFLRLLLHGVFFLILLLWTYLCIYIQSTFSCRQLSLFFFLIHCDNLFLLIEVFNPITVNLIIDIIVGIEFTILLLVFCVPHLLFHVFIISLLAYSNIFNITFQFLLWFCLFVFELFSVAVLGITLYTFNLLWPS